MVAENAGILLIYFPLRALRKTIAYEAHDVMMWAWGLWFLLLSYYAPF